MNNKKILIFFIIVVIGIVCWRFWQIKIYESENKIVGNASFLCKDSKTIEATFYEGKIIPVQSGEMPIPNGRVYLKLSDGRTMTIPQTISASGIRYANKDESFVFWSKGNGALILENNKDQTYIACVVLAKDESGLKKSYVDESGTFSIRYPADYTVNNKYVYQALGPGKDINGVKLTIPESMTIETNLSKYDTGISVEQISQTTNCNASNFLYDGAKVETITDNDITYSVGTGNDAGAGNFYEEKVWAFPDTNPCIAIRYFIHSTNIGNYDPKTVKEFDKEKLLMQFDEIRRSFIIAP